MVDHESQTARSQSVNQKVDFNQGMVIGILYGTVIDRPETAPEPPDRETIVEYLEAVSREAPPHRPQEGDEQIQKKIGKLWSMPFRAHRAGDAKNQDLEEIVTQVLDENEKRNGYQRLVLLADAGMGKTPALESLMAKTASHTLSLLGGQQLPSKPDSARTVIPIYVNLADVRVGQALTTTLSVAFNARIGKKITDGQALGLLNSKEYMCFFLLDDLDQLLSRQQTGGFHMLCQLMEAYHEHRYVVSCRRSTYSRQLGFLDVLCLDELNSDEVETIFGKEEYENLISTSKKLAHNRTALEYYIKTRKGAGEGLPPTKGGFLQKLVDERLEANRTKFADQDLNETTIQGLLETLAFRMRLDRTHAYSERQIMLVITEYLEEWREAAPWRKVARALRDCELLVCDATLQQWRFRDRCDEAYFAASAVVKDSARLEVLLREASDYWWGDVFEILVGLHQNPQRLLMDLIDRDAYVAANCIQHVAETAGQACEDALVDALIEAFWNESSARKTRIVERLGESAHRRAAEALLQILYREWSSPVLMAALKALVAWGKSRNQDAAAQQAIAEAEKKIQHSVEGQVGFISQRLSWFWADQSEGDDKEMLAYLMDASKPARARSLVALGLGVRDKANAIDHLRKLLDAEGIDDMVAWCAVEAVAMIHPQDEIHLWALSTAGEKDCDGKSQQRRARAVYLLGLVGTDPINQHLLIEALKDQNNDSVRGYAATSIARLDLIDARTELERQMDHETDPWVLHKVTEALGQIGTLDSIPFLERHLRSQQARTRWIVRRAILEILERNEFRDRS